MAKAPAEQSQARRRAGQGAAGDAVASPARPASGRAARDRPGRRRGLPLSLVVVGGMIGLLVAAMAIVVGLTFAAGLRSTTDLLVYSSQFLVQSLEARLNDELAPAARLVEHAAASAAGNPSTPAAAAPAEIAAGAMAVAPQIVAVVIESRLLSAQAAERVMVMADGSRRDPSSRLLVLLRDLAARADARDGMAGGGGPAADGRSIWGPPTYVEHLQAALLPVAATAVRPDGSRAAALALVSLDALVRDIAGIQTRGGRAFLLYGRDHLIGPAAWAPPGATDSLASLPLPRLAEVSDPVGRALADDSLVPLFGDLVVEGFDGYYIDLSPDGEDEGLGDMFDMDSQEYVVLTRTVPGFTPEPLIIGAYFRAEDVSGELDRLSRAGMAALVVVGVAAILAYLLSILITRPVRQFATNARRVAELRLDAVNIGTGEPLIREFRDATDAFRRMLHALRWFEAYVPKTLVQELLRQPDPEARRSEERVVTVMFTDIRGFTALAEQMSARQAADLLNAHFELVNACVESEGGTIDKFIGDSVMCFWGAPQLQEDHAARALRAIRQVRLAQAAANRQREAEGLPPIAIRVGVHTGRAIVGNIGSRRRVNYTLIGDVVNIANRLEALGKSLAPEADFCVLASDAVLRHCGSGFAFLPRGVHVLPGRAGKVEVFALL